MYSFIYSPLPDDYLDELIDMFSRRDLVDLTSGYYNKMLRGMGSVVFEVENELDNNRVADVSKLREIYGGDLNAYPATILEVSMALCMRFAEEVGDNWEELFWILLDKIGFTSPYFYDSNFNMLNKPFINCCKKLLFDSNIFTKNTQLDSNFSTESSQFADFFDEKSGNYGDSVELPKVDLWRQMMVWWSKNRKCDKKV